MGQNIFALLRTDGEDSLLCIYNISSETQIIEPEEIKKQTGKDVSLRDIISGKEFDLKLEKNEFVWLR
ncbi:MAG: cyclomaltodextrinase C-terminal domain-containing protein [Nitriliruptoraceae bacterium]